MRELLFMPKAWKDLGWFIANNTKNVKKIYNLLRAPAKSHLQA
jgi:Txe/YoeB family toxin of Txe-Axe toxin-antitoxin module